MAQKVAIAADHGGFGLKEIIKKTYAPGAIEWIDLGTHSTDSVDYPDYGRKLADAVSCGEADAGIAICGSGIGISIACNRNVKIRAAMCTDVTMARLSRRHNNANVLCLGERITGAATALDIVEAFLNTDFEGGRHQGRIDKLSY